MTQTTANARLRTLDMTYIAIFTVLMAVDVLLSVGAVYRQSERVNDIPADNVVREFFDTYFPDSYLDLIFPHMEYVGKPELPSAPPPKA